MVDHLERATGLPIAPDGPVTSGGTLDPCLPSPVRRAGASRRRPAGVVAHAGSARGPSGSTCTSRSARPAAATATSTRTRRPSWALTSSERRRRARPWLEGLRRELDLAARVLGTACRPPTPSSSAAARPRCSPPDDLVAVLDADPGARSACAPGAEVTTEANPESVDPELPRRDLRDAGFTRLSLGMQSASPHVLAVLDRRHTPGAAGAGRGGGARGRASGTSTSTSSTARRARPTPTGGARWTPRSAPGPTTFGVLP